VYDTPETQPLRSPYLTASEAAAYLRTTVQGIYSLVKRGRLHPMPGSGKLLFTREALDRYLATRRR
jgi:excisionase family DNA binding protein